MHKRYMNVDSWQEKAKQFIKDMLKDRNITETGNVMKIDYPEKKMYVKVTIDRELSASAYFTDSPHKNEKAQDYMLYSHQHIDLLDYQFDEIETAKARAKVFAANERAFNLIKETKLYYKEFADEYYKEQIASNIYKIRKFAETPKRVVGKVPVRVTFSLYVPEGENVLCLDCFYNEGIFSFILTTDEYPKTSTHYSFGFFEQEDKAIKGGFMILAQKANIDGCGYGLGEYDNVTPLYLRLSVGGVWANAYNKVIAEGEKLLALLKFYDMLKENEKLDDEMEFDEKLKEIMKSFKKSITQKTKEYLEKAKQQKMDDAMHVQPDIYAPPPRPFEERFNDAIKDDVDRMQKQIKDLYTDMKDKKHQSDDILKEIEKLWHNDSIHDTTNLEKATDSDNTTWCEINNSVSPPNATTFGDKNNNFLMGAIKVIVDDSDKKTTKMKRLIANDFTFVDVPSTNSWFVTDFYNHLPRYDVKKYPTGTLVHVTQKGQTPAPMNCDFSAEPLFTSITRHTTEDGVGVFWNPDISSYEFVKELPNYFKDRFERLAISRSAGKCNADINTANTSTEILPTIFYVRRNPIGLVDDGKDDPKDDSFGTFSKIGMTHGINFCSMFNMSSLAVITPRYNVNGYYGCFSLGKRKNPPTLNQKWCSDKIPFNNDGIHHIDSPLNTDSVYGYLNNYGLAYYIGEEIM